VGTPDGGVYTTAGDLNLFLDAVRKHIILNEKYAEMLLSPHCEFSNTVEWLSIPGLYKKNGYGFEFYLLEEEDMPFCIYKDGSNDGVAAKFLYYPKEDITLTVLSNQDSNIWSMIRKIQVEIYKRYYQP
ncbi:MAG: serine hydrolase, partial [Eisenbergiella sp.]